MLLRALGSLLLVFLLTPRPLAAQGPPPPAPVLVSGPQNSVAAAKPSYAQEPYVLQQLTTVYSYRADGTGYREITVAAKIQSDAALRTLGVVTVSFASASERVELHYARARHPDGSVTDTALNAALEQPAPVTREAPFYSDLKQKELPITGLHVGDTLEWQARIVRTVAEAPNQFWGSESFFAEGIALSEDVELHIPAGKRVTIWTNPAAGATPSDVTTNGERVLHWHHISTKPTVGPAAEAAKAAAKTHLLTPAEELDATEGKLPSIAFTTFADWVAVGDWYRQLAASRAVPDAAIQAKAAELTAGLTTDDARARALYNYVSLQIRYIGVAFGIGRFQPHLASDALGNQYGDCKDKHTLLSALLAAVHIPSDAVLIGEGVRFNPDVPSPEAFNHLITLAHIPDANASASRGKPVWLDTTAEIGPFQVLMPAIRDKSALVIPASTPAAIEKTPAALPYKLSSTFTVTSSLDTDLTSESDITTTYRNDTELALRAVLRQVSPAQYSEAVQNLMTGMGFGGTTSQPAIENLTDTSKPLSISFHYHRVKDESWGKDRITATFALVSVPYIDEKNPPVASIELGEPNTQTSTVAIKLPLGWSAELPEATHTHAAFASCDVTYRLDNASPLGATLYGERRVAVLQKKLPATDWKLYNAWYKSCEIGSVPYLQLVPHTAPAFNATPSVPDHRLPAKVFDNIEAAQLIRKALDAIHAKDYDKALELLRQAKALSPGQLNLWGTYGSRAFNMANFAEAIEDYRKELEYHPNATWAYSSMADAFLRLGKPNEAIDTCHKGLAADPVSDRINSTCVQIFVQQGRDDEAASTGTAILKVLPADNGYRNLLLYNTCRAKLALGDMAAALPTIEEYLKAATKPSDKNTAAYFLAETGLELPTAETATREALQVLSDESRAWTLDEAPQTLRVQSALITATWDTLGYILFRENKLDEAKSYIEASWRSRRSPDVGLHLGDILMAQHDPTAALAVYQLAQAALPTTNKLPNGDPSSTPIVAPASRPTADKLQSAIALATKGHARTTVQDARDALQKLLTVHLGPSKGYSAALPEYRLLLGQGKVEAVHTVTGTASPDAEALLRKATGFAAFTPANADAKIVLTGFINCSTGSCDFVIEP